ncbi:MAG TPA: hypothetical protein VET83_01600 [Candidatus Dormibacteraeota bacterium]|nr:hypothetical protein [Candidatus Dormibacteraeota bacterium]
MANTLRQIRRLHPLLRGLLLLYVASTLVLVAAHQHHNGLEGHDCALCTAAHTPAVVTAALDHGIVPASDPTLLTIPAEQGWDSESHRTTRSRAPPLV